MRIWNLAAGFFGKGQPDWNHPGSERHAAFALFLEEELGLGRGRKMAGRIPGKDPCARGRMFGGSRWNSTSGRVGVESVA